MHSLLWDWEGTMTNEIVRYFDLQSERRAVAPKRAAKGAAAEPPKYAPVLPQYGAVALGVLADPLLRSYIEKGTFALDLSSIAGRTVFAC
jgi:hypothetical protein